jgi:hypothetical protein
MPGPSSWMSISAAPLAGRPDTVRHDAPARAAFANRFAKTCRSRPGSAAKVRKGHLHGHPGMDPRERAPGILGHLRCFHWRGGERSVARQVEEVVGQATKPLHFAQDVSERLPVRTGELLRASRPDQLGCTPDGPERIADLVRHHRRHAGYSLPLGRERGSAPTVLLPPRPAEGDERQGERDDGG